MNVSILYAFIKQVAILFPTFVLLFSVRGFFQALTIHWAGDDTPREQGFLTLNPLAHIDVPRMLLFSALFAAMYVTQGSVGGLFGPLFIVTAVVFGIRPYYPVPHDIDEFRSPRWGLFITSFSTTVSYLALTLIAMYALVYGHYLLIAYPGAFLVVKQVAESIIEWAMVWAVISLVPLPPFEGGVLWPVLFGERGQEIYDVLEQYALFILLGLFFIPGVKDGFWYAINAVIGYLYEGLMYLVWVP